MKNSYYIFLIGILSLFLHFQHFQKDLISFHSWRQTQTYSTILNFYEEDFNILNPRKNNRGSSDGISRMEFPLFQWMNAVVFRITGPSVQVVRIFTFIIGIITLFGFFHFCYQLSNKRVLSLAATWAFNFSPSFFYYTINPLPDNLALCFLVWGLYFFFKSISHSSFKLIIAYNFLFSLAALTKLPFIIAFILPISYLIFNHKNIQSSNFRFFLKSSSLITFPIIWYAYSIPTWGAKFLIKGSFSSEVDELNYLDLLSYNLVSVFPELLINYASLLFIFTGIYIGIKRKVFKTLRGKLLISYTFACIAFFLYELKAIEKVHDYYLFMFLPILFILVGYGVYYLYNKSQVLKYITLLILLIIPVTCILRMETRWDPNIPGFNKDWLVLKNELREIGNGNDLVITGNDESNCIALYYINKKGWNFHNDKLSPELMEGMIHEGAKYLFTDSKHILENDAYKGLIGSLILQKNSIVVYSLKQK